MPPLGPDEFDEGREEDIPVATSRAPGPVQGEGGRTVVLGQAGTGRVGRLGQEQVDDPGDEEVLLVDQMDVRPAAQPGQEPSQRLTRLRAAKEPPGLELVRRAPEPGPQRRDQPDRLADAEVDTRVRDHRGGRIEQVGAGEPGLVTGDLHDGAGHRIHRRQPALKRQPHTRSLTMPTMLARPPRSDHPIAVPVRSLVEIDRYLCNGHMTRRPWLPFLGLVLILATSTAGLPGSIASPADRDADRGEEAEADGPAGSDQWFADQRLYPYRSPESLDAAYRAAQDQAVRAAAAPRAAGAAAAAWQPPGPANIRGPGTHPRIPPGPPDTAPPRAATR